MTTRTLHLIRHGEADALGALTDHGREQCRQLGRRLARLPLDALWHSPLPRAVDSAAEISAQLPRLLVDEASELIDHVPYVPDAGSLTPRQAAFFDGMGTAEAEDGLRRARSLTDRFARPLPAGRRATEELLVTHAFQVAWMVRDALEAPPESWMSLGRIENTALTTIVYSDAEAPMVLRVNDHSHLEPA